MNFREKETTCTSRSPTISPNDLLIFLEGFGFVQSYNQEVQIFFVLFCFVFILLGPHLQHLEVPRPGVESELQLLAYTTVTAMQDLSHVCDLHHSSRQHWILNLLSEARDQTQALRDLSRVRYC